MSLGRQCKHRLTSRAEVKRKKNVPSRSLKLLPMLGVPSLPSREASLFLPPGLRPASWAARGEIGPDTGRPPDLCCLGTIAADPVEESDVCD